MDRIKQLHGGRLESSSPKWSIVGEVFGTGGENIAIPEYGKYAVIALTYGHEFAGCLGADFEFGVMLFTPPFACLGGCGGEKKKLKNMF